MSSFDKYGISRFVSCLLFLAFANMWMKGGPDMDQRKIGALLRDLRKEKGITQEELAEKMMVSNRTVSRWDIA